METGSTENRGKWGENIASDYLSKQGYKIIERNFSSKFGEIDIIAQIGRYIAFVEVKLRKDDSHGRAIEFVTPAKQRRIIRTAEYYLMRNPSPYQPRFDVMEIYAPANGEIEISFIENAFP